MGMTGNADSGSTGLEVAIVGMAGRFPGAHGVAQFWRNVTTGRESISFFDPAELAAAGVPAAEAAHPDYVPAYGVVADAEGFDAAFFGYSPRDARLIDPQQRLFLQCAWEALESSGHLVCAAGELAGVYAGTSASSYLLHNLHRNPQLSSVSEYELLLANDKDSLATRVAYHLDLHGPAVTVQTACSSSLVAVHQASQALLARECDVAVAGGAHIRVPMRSGYRYETGGIMSRDGHCRAFDASATGTVGGNGIAAVVLRRLTDALRDGDTVYAVIKGSAINNDGGVKAGYTAPSVDGQAAVIETAHDVAEVDTSTVGFVEAHGTGTSLGDHIEFQALVQAFRRRTDRVGFCALGSVKALIGHLDAAAGVAGLIKASLALHHGVIPPSPYFTDPHPSLDFAAGPFYVNAEPTAWPSLAPVRRAGVSSFGIGGTNAHLVLEQAPAPAGHPSSRTNHLLVLSARTGDALGRMRERLAGYLREQDAADGGPALADVAYTLQATRRRFPHRLALVSGDAAEAAALLTEGGPGLRVAETEAAGRAVAFLFPGQGAQHPRMAAGLYATEPRYREALDECAENLRDHLGSDLRDLLNAGPDRPEAAALRRTEFAQPALFAVEYALARLWESWGVRPAAMLGHSVGELTAACLAGVFDLDDALAAVATRGRLMQAQPAGAMLSVQLPAAQVEALLPEGVSLAADNGPDLSVVAGPTGDVEAFASTLAARHVACRPLHTSHAFHSEMMEPVMDRFAEYLRGAELHPPQVPVLSNVTGDWLRPEEATDPRYWARQLREPVRFRCCAQLLLTAHAVLLEVGPGTTLATLVRQQEGTSAATIAGTLGHPARPRPDGAAVADALGRLWLAGVDVDPGAGWAHEPRRRLPLPAYPFEPARHWVDPPAGQTAIGGATPVDGAAGREPTARAGRATLNGPESAAGSDATAPEVAADEFPSGGTPVPEVIRRIWVDLLGTPDVGWHDDFFELGGHSLLGTKVIARIRDMLSVDLPAAALFQAPTISTLATAVERLRTVADVAESGPVDPDSLDGELLPELLAEIRAMSPEQLRDQLAYEPDSARPPSTHPA
jgi:acyl transferase domain-containing protein